MTEQISNFKVADRKSFVEFIELLRSELLANPDNWVNRNLDDFLEAMARYADDIQGYYDNMRQPIDADKANWQVFADILKGSSIYE
jgi:hypothetical protein